MGQVTVTLNAKTYRLRCGDGEEQRLAELAEHVGQRIEHLATQFGQFGDERLLLMAALLITDDMLELKARLARAEGRRPGRYAYPSRPGIPRPGRRWPSRGSCERILGPCPTDAADTTATGNRMTVSSRRLYAAGTGELPAGLRPARTRGRPPAPTTRHHATCALERRTAQARTSSPRRRPGPSCTASPPGGTR